MTPTELLLTPWTMDKAMHVMRRSDGEHFTNDSRMNDDQRQALVDAVNAGVNIEALQSDAFELGVKSAGGSIIPDRSKFVELALNRETIDALAQAAEAIIGEHTTSHEADAALKQFLENVSIHRSRK